MNSLDRQSAGRLGAAVASVVTLCAAFLVTLGASEPAHAAAAAPSHLIMLPGENEPASVGCATPTQCVVAGTNYVRVTGNLTDDQGTIVAVTNGVAGPAQHYPVNNLSGALHLYGATCVSWSNCLAVGEAAVGGAVATVSDGAGGGLQQVHPPDGAYFYRVACSTATSCVAVGTDGGVLFPGFGVVASITNGTAASTAREVAGSSFLYGVSCYSASNCVAVGQVVLTSGAEAIVVPIVNGAPDLTDASDVPGVASLNDVSCGEDGICYAVGVDSTGGVLVPMLDGVAGAPEQVAGVGLLTISCANAQRCLAVGQRQAGAEVQLVPIIDGDAGAPVADPDVTVVPLTPAGWGDVDCPTATACDLVGQASNSTSEDEIGVLDQLTVPGPVIGPGANRGNGQATVAFAPPADGGGTTITGYTVTATDTTNQANGGQVAHGTSSPITVAGLTNGDRYTFSVTATNVIGTGPAATTPPITPATVPGAPTGVSATAGNSSAVVSFTPPASDGENAIGGYQVEATDLTNANRGGQLAHGAGSPITISGLTNGDTYTFTVDADNQVGFGPASAPSNQVVPLTVPDPPTGVSAVAGNESAVVSFSPPTSDGGTAITGYTVTAIDGTNSAGTVQAVATSSPAQVAALKNGDSYTFTVVATNAVGNSQPSAPSAPVVPAGVRTTTTLSSSRNPSGAGDLVTLTATISPGVATGVVRFTGPGGTPLSGCGLVEVTDGSAVCTYTFAAAGSYPVTATYGGNDTYSGSSATLTQRVGTAPGAPTRVTATAGHGSAAVSFMAPSRDGGIPITGYTVTATDLTTPANGGQTGTGTTSPITVGGLTNGDVYTFSVTATNAVGTSGPSEPSAAVTPTAGTPVATVTITLTDSTGAPLGGGTASYYARGWHTIGTTTADGVTYAQLLPGSYSFAMTYHGARQQLNAQTVTGSAATVAFATSDVTVHLTDSIGAPLGGGTASYYARGWHTIGTTTNGVVDVQMLPGSYSFAMTYLGTRQQLDAQTVSGNASTVAFATGQVHSNSGTVVAYYAGVWRPFTQNMQLLSGTYTFSFTDGTPNTLITLTGDTVNTIH